MSKQPKLEAGQTWDSFNGFQIRIGHGKNTDELLMLIGKSYVLPLDEHVVWALIDALSLILTATPNGIVTG